MSDVMRLAADERRDLADLLETLTPEQWEGPTLCEDWTVRQVAAHVVSYEELPVPTVIARVVRSRFGGPDPNEVALEPFADRRPEEIVDHLRSHLTPRGATAGFGGRIALTDATIHHQDIRRPLGLIREIPEERLAPALGMALRAVPLPARRLAKGLRLVATDVGWTHGDGPEVSGPGEALLLAIAGRDVALPELSGDGVGILGERLRSL